MMIGPNFHNELVAAFAPDPVPAMSWSADGDLNYTDEVTQDQRDKVDVVLAAHDPTRPLPDWIHAEAQRRIYARLSDNTQKNLTAYAAISEPTKEELAVLKAMFAWVQSTIAASRKMAAAGDPGYTADEKWPSWDPDKAGWSDLAERF